MPGLSTVSHRFPQDASVAAEPRKCGNCGNPVTRHNRLATVGRLNNAYRRYAIVLRGNVLEPAALGNFIVGGSERAPVRLGDVAHIREGIADPRLWCARRAARRRLSTWPGASAAM